MFYTLSAEYKNLGKLKFLCPDVFSLDRATDILQYVKLYPNYNHRDWFRLVDKKLITQAVSNTVTPDFVDKKYVVFQDKDNVKESFMFVFSKNIIHEDISVQIQEMFYEIDRTTMKPVSAGFVSLRAGCYGESVSLNLQSDPSDTVLFKKTFTLETN